MKLSLRWIADHIRGLVWDTIDIQALARRFTMTVVEVEHYKKIGFDLTPYALAHLIAERDGHNLFYCPEWSVEFTLPARKGAGDNAPGMVYLIKQEQKGYRYAMMYDFHSEKEGPLPALFCTEADVAGDWKKGLVAEDYILTISNSAITHRPDLWSHRGIAREIAALLDLELIPEDRLVLSCLTKNYDYEAPATLQSPISLEIKAPAKCRRLAGLFLGDIMVKPSLPAVVQRLAPIDARSINMLVDATNYVMYDLGQPLHAFDASRITTSYLTATLAEEGEELELLDGSRITLSDADLVIGDGERPLSLAGIMGGAYASIKPATKRILVESASFDPVTIRRTATRLKKRSEASARFEKGLDPNQTTIALMRFLYLLREWKIPLQEHLEIVSLGPLVDERSIVVTHDFITKKIGAPVLSHDVIEALTRRGFGVQERILHASDIVYTITVPTYRLRDIAIKEDIVEEVARARGYDMIPYRVPALPLRPHDLSDLFRVRAIKQQCAFGLGMREVVSYPFYDEDFLRTLPWEPPHSLELSNPISERWRRLVGSLVPHLFQAVAVNISQRSPLRFFEWGVVWHLAKDGAIDERASLAALWYDPQEHGEPKTVPFDFYTVKASLTLLFELLRLPVTWQPSAGAPWCHPYQTAELYHEEQSIGYMGMVAPAFLHRIVPGGIAYVAELNGQFLKTYRKPLAPLMPLPRYPSSDLDISMFVPAGVTVSELEQAVAFADARVRDVYLIDYYSKAGAGKATPAQRSVTLRYHIADDFKTLTKEEIDEVARSVEESVKKLGVFIR
jgi:phenylalanyl-tRNA synthetase beta chain